MMKQPRYRLTEDAKFSRDLGGNRQFVTAREPVDWKFYLKVGLIAAATFGATYAATPAHSAEVKIIRVTHDSVRHVRTDNHPSLHPQVKDIVNHPSIVVSPTDVRTRTQSDNQNAVRILGE